MGSHVIFVEKELDDSSHGIAGGSLYGVDSGWDENDGFVDPEPDNFLIAEGMSFGDLESFLSLMRGDDNKI